MGHGATSPQVPADRCVREWAPRLRPILVITIGTLLIGLAGGRLAPYVRTRIDTSLMLARGSQGLQPTSSGVDAALDGQPGAASTNGAPEPDTSVVDGESPPGRAALASIALVPTPKAPPTRLVIPAISLDVPVVPVDRAPVRGLGGPMAASRVPARRVAGWYESSASLGVAGNTVVSAHNAGYGEAFRDLYLVEAGDTIVAYSGDTPYVHTVSDVVLVQEEDRSLEGRRRNARHVEPTEDERLTLVTCHPYGSLRYRLIVVAHRGVTPSGLETRRGLTEE